MPGDQVFCSKCGSSISPGSAFCGKCGAAVATRPPTTQAPMAPRRMERGEKHEKHEKGEKNEKQEKGGGSTGGALAGGSVLIWLGITFYLQRVGVLGADIWWAYFLLGIGGILIADGLVRSLQKDRAFPGLLIGGAVLVLIGATSIQSGWQDFWPLLLVVLGVAVIAGGLTSRRRSPTP